MSTLSLTKTVSSLGLALLLISPPARAASIQWDAPQNIMNDPSQVSTKGELLYAINFGGYNGAANPKRINTTINDVEFVGVSATELNGYISTTATNWSRDTTAGNFSGLFNTLSLEYQTLLRSFVGNSPIADAPTSFSITLEGLSIGSNYEIQLWVSNSQGKSAGGYTSTEITSGGSVTLKANVTEATGGLGQFVIGTFRADDITQTITFTTTQNNSQAVINALQVRQIPEPGSYAMMLVGAGMATLLFRRKTTSFQQHD